MEFEFTTTLSDGRIVLATVIPHPAIRGRRNRLGVPEEPDEPAYIEIVKITTDVEFTEPILDQIERDARRLLAEADAVRRLEKCD